METGPSDAKADDRRLDWIALGLYGLPGMGVNFLFSLVLILYMKFATDELGLTPGTIGAIFFVSRIWDAVSDPVAGTLSDRTRLPFGRRKSWLLASALPLAAFSVAMWAPPVSLSGTALIAWTTVAILGFYTAYTLFEVPHMALGAELTHDPRSRVRVFGARQLLRTLGLFAAGTVGAGLMESPDDPRATAFALSVGAGLVALVTIVFAVLALPREREDYTGRGGAGLSSSLRDVWRNPHARVLLLVFFLEQMGIGGIGALAPYVLTYVIQLPDLLNEMLVAYMLPALLSVPVWVHLGGRFEKRKLWMLGLLLGGGGFGSLFFVSEGSVALVMIGAVAAGLGSGCGATLGQALKADVIDVDEHRTSERKEGAYFAAWNFVSKMASGVMLGLVGVSLQLVGFVPNEPQSELTLFTMRFLIGGMPMLGFAVALVALRRFSLTEGEHARIRREIDARATTSDP